MDFTIWEKLSFVAAGTAFGVISGITLGTYMLWIDQR